MSTPPLTGLVDLVAEHLFNGLILSSGIFVGTVVLLPLIFRSDSWSAATRHRAWLLTFVCLASTPLLVVLKPARSSHETANQQIITNESVTRNVPAFALVRLPDPEPVNEQQTAPPAIRIGWWQKVDWPLALFAGWAFLTFICGLRLLAALYRLRTLHRSAQPVALAEQLLSSRPITVAESPLVSSPVAVGLWPAKVLLPVCFQSAFTLTEQRNVLLHEVAHLERFDDWATFLQQLLIAVFPINPFLWVISRLLQLHQEAACDDRVLAKTHQAKSYASLLARLADGNIERSLLASGVSRQGKQLYQRLTRILDSTRNRAVQPSWHKVMVVAIGLLGACAAGLVWLPAVVWAPEARASESQTPPASNNPEPSKRSLDPEIISLLTSCALNDPDPGVRQEAAFALSDHDGDDVTTALLSLLNESKDEEVKIAILHRLTPRRAADPRVKDKLNDLALHEKSIPIRTTAIELLSRHVDDNVINQLITIYRAANGFPIKAACLRGLGPTDSKIAREFLISIAKEDPEPEMRCIALRAIAKEQTFVDEFGFNGKRVAFAQVPDGMSGPIEPGALEAQRRLDEVPRAAQEELSQRLDVYRKKLDALNRLNEEAGIVTLRRGPLPDGQFGPPENRFFFLTPGPEERNDPHFQGPFAAPKRFPDEPKVDPSPKPSPSATE
jgi:beta-lactamase regulating signal transducer with metallopeptidase domain